MIKKLLLALLLTCVTSAGNAQLTPGEPPLHAGATPSKTFGSIITDPFGTPSTGGRLTFVVPGNNGVLITNGSGAPTISSTLPSGISATNMNLTTPSLGVATATSINGLTLSGSAGTMSVATGATRVLYLPDQTNFAGTIYVGNGGGSMVTPSFPTNNTFTGIDSGLNLIGGYYNTGNGHESLKNLTYGYTNTANGRQSMYSTTIGLENTCSGYRCLYSNIDGYQNTSDGSNSMYYNVHGYNNVANGMYSLFNNIGSISAPNGYSNTASGFQSCYSNITGSRNVCNGADSLFNADSDYNSALGMYSCYDLTSGSSNLCLGYNTGLGLMTGSGNTIVGAQISGLSPTLTNSVVLGNSNGNIRLFVDSAGLMGIGTVTPGAKLQLTGGDFYVSTGAVGIGNNTLTGYTLRLGANITGAATSHAVFSGGSIRSDVTGAAYMMRTQPTLQATAFNLSFLYHFAATQGTFGAGSSNSVQHGFFADSSLIGATNNYGHYAENTAGVTTGKTAYGFYSNVNVATGGGTAWGFYGGGTAPNRLNSDLLVYGGTAIPAGGTAGSGYKFSSTSNFGVFFGSGAPTLAAAQGSLYARSDGPPQYNNNGTTGWTELLGATGVNVVSPTAPNRTIPVVVGGVTYYVAAKTTND